MERNETTTEHERDTLKRCLALYLESGDEEAMEVIVRRTRSALLRVARRIGAPQDAEDAVQSAYFSLLRKQGQRLDIPVLPWLKTAVIRIAYRQKAKQKKQHDLARLLSRPAGSSVPLDEIVRADEAVRVRREIARLPSSYRDPVVLRYLQGLSVSETARLLETPDATVRTRLHRARQLLKGRLPAPVRYSALVLPWLVSDLVKAIRGALVEVATGSATPVPAAAIAIALAGALGTTAGALLPDRDSGLPRLDRIQTAEDEVLAEETRTIREDIEQIGARRRENALRLRTALSLLAVARGEIRALTGRTEADLSGPGPKGQPPLAIPERDEALGDVDWNVVGAASRELVANIDAIARARIRGEEIGARIAGRTQELNGILIQISARVQRTLRTEDISLANLDPGYMLDLIASTLLAAGRPLNEEQAARIAREARAAILADAAARPLDLSEDYEILRRHHLALRRQDLFDAVAGVLTETQLDILWSESIRGRLLCDLLSPSHAYHLGIEPVLFRDPAALADRLLEKLERRLAFEQGERPAAQTAVRDWIDSLPAEILAPSNDPLDGYCWVSLEKVRAMVPHTIRLYRRIEDDLPLGDSRITLLRDGGGVIVLIPLDPD